MRSIALKLQESQPSKACPPNVGYPLRVLVLARPSPLHVLTSCSCRAVALDATEAYPCPTQKLRFQHTMLKASLPAGISVQSGAHHSCSASALLWRETRKPGSERAPWQRKLRCWWPRSAGDAFQLLIGRLAATVSVLSLNCCPLARQAPTSDRQHRPVQAWKAGTVTLASARSLRGRSSDPLPRERCQALPFCPPGFHGSMNKSARQKPAVAYEPCSLPPK